MEWNPNGRDVMAAGQVKVAVVGLGDIGRGWAALCVAHGWPVSVYDHEARSQEAAADDIAARARGLLALVGADAEAVERGVASLRPGRSLLQACAEADWVIEAIHEDLMAKQKTLEALESGAPRARAVTSSSSTFQAADVAARCRRQDRIVIANPQNPPELIPLVELLPGPATDRAMLELLKGWLRALGRIPVTLKKPVRGNVAGRISAAVWREAIQLVLDGAIDVDDLDRAVSVGPALAWAAAGPHLSYRLSAGKRSVHGHLQQVVQSYEAVWSELASWNHLEPERQQQLIALIERAYRDNVDQLRTARDRRLAAILQGLELSRRD
jgi:3-hydroxyacyl-CoA dehydrogenase